ncbi:MAG TPA: hypothetical protein VHS05_24165 [Pyrinomonadaceae bacterium]|jgi:hypothetical protein|nr:hypothetical protein [Pyrinomonadaceae bacterium]
MSLKNLVSLTFTLAFAAGIVNAQEFSVAQTKVFAPQNKKILLLKDTSGERSVILFQTNLRVNTDGSPLSYHPQDPRGQTKALNNVCNAVAVRKVNSDTNLCRSHFGQAINIFEQFRDSNFQTVPAGFRITWENVLATTQENGKKVPCIFKTGEFKGYFGSLTALRNGLTTNKGECDINDQVNPMIVPALVLVGGQNPVRDFGAQVGDLLIAFNPKTQLFTSAIIGDTGPKDNLGEGSVLLNMKLRGITTPPTNKHETFALSIEDTKVLIAIIPGSRLFRVAKPYTAENIDQRLNEWRTGAGFTTPEKLIEMMKSFQSRLN